MKKPQIPENEKKRLQALQHLNILDTQSEDRFDRLTRIAKRYFKVPIALVSLVDVNRQWFKSHQGLDATETPRDISFCGHAILNDDLFIIPDTLADSRFADNPLVTGPPDIRFYAGAPLIDEKGYRLGTLCIIDTEPRDISTDDFKVLRDLADTVQAELARTELLRASRILKSSEQQIYDKNRLLDAISRAQSRFIQDVNVQLSFVDMLSELLELTSSHFGVIAEVITRPDGSRYLKPYALTDIVWNEESKHFYADNTASVMTFSDPESLLATVLKTSQIVIANDLSGKSVTSGFPENYPAITSFLGIPVYQAGQLSGVVGLGNCQQGYDQAIVEYLSPLINTIGTLVEATHNELRRKLINDELSRFKYVLDHTLDMIFMFDSETLQFNYLNEGAAKSMAYSKAELLQMHPYDIKPLISQDEFVKIIEPLKSGQSDVLNFETIHRRKDGVDFPVGITLQLVRENSGAERFIAVVHDITERKAYENKLLDAEQQMRAVIDTVVDGIITIDATGIVQSFNPAAEHIFAYSAQQVIGQNIKMLMPEPFQKEHDGYLQHYLHTGERKVIGIGREVIGQRQTGENFPMELAVSEMTVKGERMFTGIVREITQRKETERQLYETNTIRKGILDSANFSIIYTDKEGLIQSFNHSAERMLGYSADEVVGKLTAGILHDVNEVVARAAELSAETGQNIEPGFEVFVTRPRQNKADEHEWTYIRKNGSRFPVLLSITAVTDSQGEIMGFLGIGKDLSAQKLAEAEVQARDIRIRAILDTVVDGIIVINDEGLVQTFNPAAEQLFGYSAEEIMGCSVNQLMMDYYTSKNIDYLLYENSSTDSSTDNSIDTQDSNSRELVARHKDGSSFPVELSISEMQIHGEQMYTSIVRDITERKRIDKMKSQFVSTVSHELRTPLTSIRGALGLVLAGAVGEVSKEAMDMLQMANRNSISLTLLINDILDLEKIESGRMEFDFKSLDLSVLVKQAVEANQGYAAEHQVKIKVTGESASLLVNADENRLLQVFANLISNAVKYSPENDSIDISLSHDKGWARVSITDKGHGIPEEFHSRIFQRFAQADSSDTREKGGTGLGLSITSAIIEQLHGQIGFTSVPDVATTFYFELPETTHVLVSNDVNTDEIRVLICEDNPDVSLVLSTMLNNEGLVCDVASSAAGAKKLIEQNDYKVMLLDLGLPDQQGVDLIRDLKSNEQSRELPIIVVSALANETKKQLNGDAVIVVDWIQKPVDKNRLFKAINNALTGTTRPRVLHVEDSLDVVQITGAIIGEMAEYEYATSLQQARKLIKKQVYDLLILDVVLPDGSGLDLLPEIDNKSPVIIFSGEEVGRDIKNEIAAILTKSETSNDQLMATIRKIIYRSRK